MNLACPGIPLSTLDLDPRTEEGRKSEDIEVGPHSLQMTVDQAEVTK